MSWSSAVHTPTNITNITSTPKLGREATTHMNFAGNLLTIPVWPHSHWKECVGEMGKRKRRRKDKRKKTPLPVKCTKKGSILSGSVPQAAGRLDLYVKV